MCDGGGNMRKIGVCLVVVSVLLCMLVSTSIAEPFSIRNGVSFGMGAETVIEIENNAGNKGAWDQYTSNFYSIKDLQILGADHVTLTYCFWENQQGELYQIGYNVNKGQRSAYASFVDALTTKYGEPEYTLNNGKYLPYGALMNRIKNYINKPTYTFDYCEWQIPFDEYAVVIGVYYQNSKIAGKSIEQCEIVYNRIGFDLIQEYDAQNQKGLGDI